MTTLFRFAWRELFRAKARLTLIALILTIQAAALGGGYLAQASLYHTRDAWSERLHLADLDVHFVPASAEEIPSLETLRAIPGVAAVDRRFIALGYIEKTDSAPLPVVIQYLDPAGHPPVDDVAVLSGRWLERGKPELAIVDRSFAEAQHLALGDAIVVNPRRLASKFIVGGTGLSAEHLIPTANPEMLVPHKGSLGIVYASREALDRTFPDELYNDVVVTFREGADPTDAVLAALGKLEIERVVRKKATFSHRFVDVVLSGSRSVAPMIALIIALMAAIVAFVSLHRLVAERRREIGCLLAQGFSPQQLAACFFVLGLAPGILGAIAGIPTTIAFTTRVTRMSAEIAGLPKPIMIWEVKWFVLAATSAIVVGLLSALPPSIGVLRMRPSQALRGAFEVRFTGLPSFLEKLLAGSTAVRYAVRNVFRRVRLSFATAVLVALAVALPSGLLTSMASWESWAKASAEKLRWDAIASFKVPLAEENVAELMDGKGVSTWDGYVQGYASVRREDGYAEEMRIRGLPATSDLVKVSLTEGRPLSGEHAREAILNAAFAGEHPPRVGETVTIVRHGVRHRLVVVGLLTDAALSTVVVPRGTAQNIFGLEGKVSGAYVRFGAYGPPGSGEVRPPVTKTTRATNAEILETIDIDETPPPRIASDPKTALLDDELVTNVEVRTEYADATLKYLSAYSAIIVPFIGLSGILAFFFLLSVLGFLLLERETEYATLRSMGFGAAEIARIVLTEVAVLAAIGIVLSLGAWLLTAYALRAPMARTWFPVPLDFRAHDFALASLPTLLFLVFAAIPGIRALLRIDLSSTLRGRALG